MVPGTKYSFVEIQIRLSGVRECGLADWKEPSRLWAICLGFLRQLYYQGQGDSSLKEMRRLICGTRNKRGDSTVTIPSGTQRSQLS